MLWPLDWLNLTLFSPLSPCIALFFVFIRQVDSPESSFIVLDIESNSECYKNSPCFVDLFLLPTLFFLSSIFYSGFPGNAINISEVAAARLRKDAAPPPLSFFFSLFIPLFRLAFFS